MTNFNLENLNEVIEDVLIEFCETFPIPDFTKEEHLNHLRSVLEQMGLDVFVSDELFEAISLAPKKFTLEAPVKKAAAVDPETKVRRDAHKKGLEGKGGNAYGPKGKDIITYRNQKGKLVPVTPPQPVGKAKAQAKVPAKVQPKVSQPKPTTKVQPKVQPKVEPKVKSAKTGSEKTPTGKQEPVKVNLDGKLTDVFGRFENNKNNATSIANVTQAIKSVSSQLNQFAKDKKNPHSADHKKVSELVVKLFKGEKLTPQQKAFVARYIRVAEPTDANPNACKIYVAREPDNFTSQGPKKRERIYVGAKDKSTPVIGAFRQWVEKNGVPMLATSTFGGKKTTANQTYIDKAGKTRIIKNATEVKEKGGKVESVRIGALNIVRMDPAKAKNPYEQKIIAKNNRLLEEYAEKIKANDMDFIDMDSGAVPDSPENRVKVIREAIGGMALNLAKLADKASVGDPNTRKLIKELADYSKLDPNKNPEQWLSGFENLLSRIANHDGEPSLKEAWANYAEIFVAIREMHDNGKGTQNGKCALLPQSTTLETVDVITVSNGRGDSRIVTLDGRSVKKGVGGASALTSKCRKSTYKNDPKGLIKKGVIELSESHNKPYELSMEKPLDQHKKLNNEYQKYLKEKAKQLRIDPKFVSSLEKDLKTKGGRGFSKVQSAVDNIKLERKKAGLDISEQTMSKVRMRLESYYMYSELAHEAYNANVDVQDFANDSVLSQKEDRGGAALAKAGKIAIDRSNGIDILAYPKPEFNIGFTLEGKSKNPGAGRFHNEKKRA